MTHPTPPKQYFLTCDHSLVDTGRAPDDTEDGFFMFADEALAYANDLAAAREKQARLDALEEVIGKLTLIRTKRLGIGNLYGKSPERCHEIMLTEAIYLVGKLKEGV